MLQDYREGQSVASICSVLVRRMRRRLRNTKCGVLGSDCGKRVFSHADFPFSAKNVQLALDSQFRFSAAATRTTFPSFRVQQPQPSQGSECHMSVSKEDLQVKDDRVG